MGIVNLKFRNHTIQVECNNEERVRSLSDKLKAKVEGMNHLRGATDTKLIYLVALMLEDEIDSLKKDLAETKSQLEDEFEHNNQILSDTLNYVAEYLENIADKYEK